VVIDSTFRKKAKFTRATIDNYGLVKLEFSDNLVIPDFEKFKGTELDIVVVPSGLVEINKLDLEW
jgi:hypothetical protein